MKLSLVIPSYNEKDNIHFIYGQIMNCHLEKIIPELEIIYVDDGSIDGTFGEIRKLSQKDNRIKGMQFSRNFGKPVAILAGLKESSGDIVITLDADGQHPPALIPELINILNFFSEIKVEPFSTINYHSPGRHTGKSKFNLRKLFRLGMDGITSFSTRPVKISFMIGLFVIFLGLIYAIYSFFNFFFGHTTPGWTSLMIVLLLLGGIQLLSLGIIGEYISRIFSESKKRPHCFFQDRC